jgi:hypothetical protein
MNRALGWGDVEELIQAIALSARIIGTMRP